MSNITLILNQINTKNFILPGPITTSMSIDAETNINTLCIEVYPTGPNKLISNVAYYTVADTKDIFDNKYNHQILEWVNKVTDGHITMLFARVVPVISRWDKDKLIYISYLPNSNEMKRILGVPKDHWYNGHFHTSYAFSREFYGLYGLKGYLVKKTTKGVRSCDSFLSEKNPLMISVAYAHQYFIPLCGLTSNENKILRGTFKLWNKSSNNKTPISKLGGIFIPEPPRYYISEKGVRIDRSEGWWFSNDGYNDEYALKLSVPEDPVDYGMFRIARYIADKSADKEDIMILGLKFPHISDNPFRLDENDQGCCCGDYRTFKHNFDAYPYEFAKDREYYFDMFYEESEHMQAILLAYVSDRRYSNLPKYYRDAARRGIR